MLKQCGEARYEWGYKLRSNSKLRMFRPNTFKAASRDASVSNERLSETSAGMSRWSRLCVATIAMAMIGNLQYSWTICVGPIMSGTHWTFSGVQWGFTVLIAAMTWTMPFAGWLIDRFGPRAFMNAAAALCGAGWALLAYSNSLHRFYASLVVVGIGSALVYCCCTALGLKWFPDKRGIASGLIASGYASGASLFNPVFAHVLASVGYRTAFCCSGLILGGVILAASRFLKYPENASLAAFPPSVHRKVCMQSLQFDSFEMLRTRHFYLLFLAMALMATGGLMTTAHLATVAQTFRVREATITFSLAVSPLANGASRFFWGWVSDLAGHLRTVVIAFALHSVFLLSVITLGRCNDISFVACVVLVFFTWGEAYALLPVIVADTFGARYAAANYSLLYASKGLASILAGGAAARLFEKTGSWNCAFYTSSLLALCAAIAAAAVHFMPIPIKLDGHASRAGGDRS
jgi:OFA family oxalate/formate antiporter-like MFS transporter